MNKQYYKNTALLFAAMAVTKIVGAIFKIPLANILGGTGMGYFSTAYGLYSPVFAITAAGVPTVIMRLTAQNIAVGRAQNALKIKKTALLIFSVMGALGCFSIWAVSEFFAEHIAFSPESVIALKMIAPAVFFCSIGAVIRGYYEGQSNVIPSASANIVEAVSRAAIGLALSYGTIIYSKYCYDNSLPLLGRYYNTYDEIYSAILPYSAAAAILAVTLSELCGLVLLILHDKKQCKKNQPNDNIPTYRYKKIVVCLFSELTPIAASALVMNFFSFTDLITVTRTLEKSLQSHPEFFYRNFLPVIRSGIPIDALANFMYGSYTGIAMSLFMLIPSFAGMTEKTAIPEIATAWERKDIKVLREKTSFLLRISGIIGFPACFGAYVLAEPIMNMLYSNRIEEVSVCINAFKVLCLGGIFLIMSSAISGIFQAIGKAYIPLWLMCGAVAIKAILNPILVSITDINITGAAIATIISYASVVFVSSIIIKRYIPGFKIFKPLFIPFFSALICAFTAKYVYIFLEKSYILFLSIVFSVISGGFVYVLSLIISGVFRTSPIIKGQKQKKIIKGLAKKLKIG